MSYKYLKVTNLKNNVFQVILNNPEGTEEIMGITKELEGF